MRKHHLLFLLGWLLLLSHAALADFVEVRRAVSVRATPESGADVAFKAALGANLHLLESETTNGFYHVQDPQSGAEGWIFRSFVRRFPGDIPSSDGSGAAAGGSAFPVNKCKPPYNEEPSSGLAVETCGVNGDSASKSGEFPQNQHKNELCATGAAQDVTIADLLGLQHEVDESGMPFGSFFGGGSGPPKDRTPLTNLPALPNGLKLEEGDVVSFVGFLAEAHYMPKSESVPKKGKGGESVNCHSTQHAMADIHLAFSSEKGRITAKDPQKQQKTCNTISGEMIPHLRPEVWNIDNLNEVIDLERPVRITGHLFFDASHVPCRDGKITNGNPLRISGWEIHPIYTFEVCKFTDSKKCLSNNKAAWQPLSRADGVEIGDDEENP
jgi:hypothetical protein